MDEKQTYTYYAFVSYSHKDEKWGKWVQNALERYRLPAAVRKEVGKPLPQKIHPVFRDDTDLGACRLEVGLQQELEQSRFLIVVCSPNSAKPNAEGKHWVNEEVKRFCEMGRANRVIPVIVKGTKEEAFCPKLVEEDLLALDATKHPRVRILNDLVAKILGLRPDELWRREERRLCAKRRWRIFTASVAALFVALGGYIWWDCTRTVTRAFADYVDSYGLPKGIFPLTPEQVAKGHVHYKFEFHGYRCEWFGKSIHADSSAPSLLRALGFRRTLWRVEHSELEKKLSRREHDIVSDLQFNRPIVQSFAFGDDGRITRRKVEYAASGGHSSYLAIECFNWVDKDSKQAIIIFRDHKTNNIIPAPLAAYGIPDDYGTGGGVFAWKVTFDSQGRFSDITYLDSYGHVVNDRGAGSAISHSGYGLSSSRCVNSGLTFEVDDLGRISEMRMKGRRDGVSSNGELSISYGRGTTSLEMTVSQNGEKKVHNPFLSITYDDNGRPSSVRFGKEETYALFRPEYDSAAWEDDYVELESRYNLTEYTTNERNPAGWNSEYDDEGNEIHRRFVDAEGNPAMVDNGYAGWDCFFDKAGREWQRICVGLDNRPIAVEAGPAGWTVQYGATNEVFSFVDVDFKQCFCRRKHFASRESVFDLDGNEVSRVYRNAEGKPKLQPNGYTGWLSAYDANGNETNTVFLGAMLLPSNQPEGYAGYSSIFDVFGREISRRFFDSAGKICANQHGYAGWNKLYDIAGQETNRVFISANGALTLVEKSGLDERTGPIAGWWKEFSANAELVALGTLGTNGLPMVNQLGWASKQFAKNGELWFDEQGKIIIQSHPSRIIGKTFGSSPFEKTTWWVDEETGARMKGKDGSYGYHEWINENDEVTNRLYLAQDGSPCVTSNGYAGYRVEYKAQYKPISTTFYDLHGNAVVSKNDGYATKIETWDERGKDTSVYYLDEKGNIIEKYPDEGYAYKLYEFYPFQYQEKSMTYMGTDSKPVNHRKYGYARIEYDVEPTLHRIGRMFFRANGEPHVFPNGGHSGDVEFRDYHYNTTNYVYLGADGKPMLNRYKGFASCTTFYDYTSGTTKDYSQKRKGGSYYGPNGLRIAGQSYFDPEGNPIAKKTGEVGWRDKFDDDGRQIKRTYFGTNGLPVMTEYGFATRQIFYDETTGVETNRVLLDADGNVIPPKKKDEKKKYSWKTHYDEAGLLVKETYEAEDGTLGTDSLWSKVSFVEYKYDDKGHETNRIYRGLQGQPVFRSHFAFGIGTHSENSREKWLGETDYSELRCQYNMDGFLAEKSFWGTNGIPVESSSGSHVIRYTYNSSGIVSEESHFSTNGLPCLAASGYHIQRRSYSGDGSDKAFYFDVDGTTELCGWEVSTIESADLSRFDPVPDIQPGDIVLKRVCAHIFPLEDYSASFRPEWKDVITRNGISVSSSCEESWRKRIGEDEWAIANVFILARKTDRGYECRAFAPGTLWFSCKLNKKKSRLPLEEGKRLAHSFIEWLKFSGKDDIIEVKSKGSFDRNSGEKIQ